MNDTTKQDARRLTFAQRHLGAPLPAQLKREDMPDRLRYRLWQVIDWSMKASAHGDSYTGPGRLFGNWLAIMADFHTDYLVQPHDTFKPIAAVNRKQLREIIIGAVGYQEVYGALDFVLLHPLCPSDLPAKINEALTECMAAWRVYDGNLLGPLASEEESKTVEQAFSTLAASDFEGARAHLRMAVTKLTEGHFADSIRESISAVEGTAKALEPSKSTHNDAMKKLVASGTVSKALSQGLEKLYAWTGDEEGLRHSLVFADKADVDETDALFMIGACAAFITYLISRSRENGR